MLHNHLKQLFAYSNNSKIKNFRRCRDLCLRRRIFISEIKMPVVTKIGAYVEESPFPKLNVQSLPR